MRSQMRMRSQMVVCRLVVLLLLGSSANATLIVRAVATGTGHNLALASDGTVWMWGQVPVQVSGLAAVVKIAAGGSHNLAFRSDGTVWAWGKNDSGQSGDGTTTDLAAPVQVGGLSDVIAIAAGNGYSLALKKAGRSGPGAATQTASRRWCWPVRR